MEITDYPRTNTNQSLCGTVNKNNYDANKYATCKTTSWMFNSDEFYSRSFAMVSDTKSSALLGIDPRGYVTGVAAKDVTDVYPVLTLKSNISMQGSGSSSDPFTIVNN